ncbi:MAG: thiamine pyrophosphate-dependent enzyme [Flavobacteriales bacterium AspAUS03]
MDIELKVTMQLSFEEFRQVVLSDYKLASISREVSLLGRREVLSGNAKFGTFGDGKELPQLAMAKVFKKGDFRSGYYRDQTFMMAIGALTVRSFFAQLYAHTEVQAEPASAGRMMPAHFATRFLDEEGRWKVLIEQNNSSADISCTAGQLPRLIGFAQASKIYKHLEMLEKTHGSFSRRGDEVAFGTIGNASTAQGLFWESINAAGVLQVPMILSVWDDGYGISVPNSYQFAKENLSTLLAGFQRTSSENGLEIITVEGWNYTALVEAYVQAEKIARREHIPVLVHVSELTQPQGHSTSGSHERYKSKERLEWERSYDGLKKFHEWILDFELIDDHETLRIADIAQLDQIDLEAKKYVSEEQKAAWEAFRSPIQTMKQEALSLLQEVLVAFPEKNLLKSQFEKLNTGFELTKRCVFSVVRQSICLLAGVQAPQKDRLLEWFESRYSKERSNYSSHLHSLSVQAAIRITEVLPTYVGDDQEFDGRIVLRDNFDKLLETHPDLLIFGEDVGKIGDVNQGLEGLQAKYGEIRVSDTGIREATMIGQGIGMSMRGLRPIVEIQYLDYVLYALHTMSDDLACLHYRTGGGQKAPVIIRTRGYRLEGIWHSGSPMGGLLHFLRGVLILVPRNMVKAAGFYNTLLAADEPALVVECLNGYRLKEKLPSNLGAFRTPIGQVETTRVGRDITLVTYGSTWRVVTQAAEVLSSLQIEAEVIDVQSLLPFDIHHNIVKGLTKTHRLIVIDEDVPGGASAYLLQKILEEQDGYHQLDSQPLTVTAQAHRPAYGSDGDYFSKPSVEDVVEKVYRLMHEAQPVRYPLLN